MAKDKIIMDEIGLNAKSKIKRSKNLLSELEDLEDESVLPSNIFSSSKERKKEKNKKKNKDIETPTIVEPEDEWMMTLTTFKTPKTKKTKKNIFDEFGIKKKRKGDKSKKKGGPVNHKKDFDPEMVLLRNLQMDQNKFVDSLQKKYDQMEGTKSTARGIGKFTTDLIMSITNARSLSMQLVDKIISTKKTIADLDFKERKEFGSQNSAAQVNLNDYASTYLKQMLNTGREMVTQENYYPIQEINDTDSDDLFDGIQDSLETPDENGDIYHRSEDSEKFLKYENENIKIQVIWHDSVVNGSLDEQYDFIAVDSNGNIISDYPLPNKTKLNINRSTSQCTDTYGIKYELIIDD